MTGRPVGLLEQLFLALDRFRPMNVVACAHLSVPPDLDRVTAAAHAAQAAHPLLRARLDDGGGMPRWRTDAGPLPLSVRARQGEDHWLRVAEEELALPFDLACGPLCRLTVLNGADGADLLLAFHHAVADAQAGMQLLAALLGDGAAGVEGALPAAYEHRAASVLRVSPPLGILSPGSLAAAPWRARLTHRRLDARTTAALAVRARAEGSTVHGALAAALLIATGRSGAFGLTSPVSVRHALGDGDIFTLAVAEVTTAHMVRQDQPFWPLAAAISAAVRQRAAPEVLLPAHLAALEHLAGTGRLEALAGDIARFAPDRLGLTNLGRVVLPGSPPLDFAVVPPATQAVLAAVTGGDGCLGLTLTHPDPCMTSADAESLMDHLMVRLSAVAESPSMAQAPPGTSGGIDLSELSPAKRRLLALRLRQRDQQALRPSALGRSPLSYNQRAMWFLSRLAPDSAAYTLPYAAAIDGPLDPAMLDAALALLRARHDVLDARFPMVEGEPVQDPAPEQALDIRHVDAAGWDDETLQRAVTEAYARPFDLVTGLGWRAVLFRRDAARHVLFLALHHIVIDFWSLVLLVEDLRACLAALQAGSEPPPAPRRRYADFTAAQRAWLSCPEGTRAREHWHQRLKAPLPALDLPTDRPRPPVQGFRGGSLRFSLGPTLSGAASAMARERGVTLFALLAAVCQTLLHRWSGAAEVLVGTPTVGREGETFAATIGDFINPVVLRADFSDKPTFAAHLARTAVDAATALGHRAYPFPLLLEELAVSRDPSRPPVFQAMVVLQNQLAHAGRGATTSDGPEFRRLDIDLQGSQLDLTFEFRPEVDDLHAEIKYDRDLFDAATVARLRGHLLALLAGALREPDTPVAALPLIGAQERQTLVEAWNDTRRSFPVLHPLALLRARVQATPDAIAVSRDAEHLSYAALWARAGSLAGWLAGLGVGEGDRVGICLERSPDLVAVLLAVWRCGAAYVPLDPEHPADRLAYIVADADCAVVLVDAGTRGVLADTGCRLAEPPVDPGEAAPMVREDAARPAYVLYTSGTTGRPKGVAISHHNLGNFLAAMQDLLALEARDCLLAVTTLSFDIAGLELFLPLSAGARVEIASTAESRDGVLLARRLAAADVSVMQATPAGWRLLLAAGWRPDARLVMLVGGEALPRDLADALLPEGAGCTLWNLFGPTETTIWSTAERVQRAAGPVPIGRPIGNTRIYVVDPAGQPAPIGVVGELLIGGDGVALGYHGRPDLTAERFGSDPFAPGGRIYRTGDLARWRADGVLMFHGRIDHQVKMRGFRIELEEIEAVLAEHPAVIEAVADMRTGADGDGRLVAWVVHGDAMPSVEALRSHLVARLPAYMVPQALSFLSELPRTPNGKIDRKALSDPTPLPAAPPIAPSTDVEDRIAALWRDVLGRKVVGVHDSFFDLGGHSLLLARLQARLNAELAELLPEGGVAMTDLFRFPTIAGLAGLLTGSAGGTFDGVSGRAGLRRAAQARQAARRWPARLSGEMP
jgi:amino acid adenylation domain-containing protein